MTTTLQELNVIDFHRFPPVGREDWRYVYATAYVRSLETNMLGRGTFIDMANAPGFDEALDLLSSSEYAMGQVSGLKQAEEFLLEKRAAVRDLFVDLMLDKEMVELLRSREDFANMRLAVRRVVTERPVGTDYIPRGSVPVEEFEEIFENENYDRFPQYLQEAVEAAVLGYYQNEHDIREIDFNIDRVQAQYRLKKSREIGSVFLLSFFRMKIDLNNIRTMLRLKMAEQDRRDLFIEGGFLETDRFVHGLELGYEGLGQLFYATPYFEIVDSGTSYLTSNKSFLRLERLMDEYTMGFLHTTQSIAAGPQPVIAYMRMKEFEVRTIRMVLTGKYNGLDAKYITDRLPEA